MAYEKLLNEIYAAVSLKYLWPEYQPTFRKSGRDSLFITDSGNYIIDLQLNQIQNPQQLAFELKNMVGVVDHGLFLNYPDVILVGKEDGEIVVHER